MKPLRLLLFLVGGFMFALVTAIITVVVYKQLRYPETYTTQEVYEADTVFLLTFGLVAVGEAVVSIWFFTKSRKRPS